MNFDYTPREKIVIDLRENKKLTYREIGLELGFTPSRILQIYKKAKSRFNTGYRWYISVRASNCLMNKYGISPLDLERKEVRDMILADMIDRDAFIVGVKNLGRKTYNELRYFLENFEGATNAKASE